LVHFDSARSGDGEGDGDRLAECTRLTNSVAGFNTSMAVAIFGATQTRFRRSHDDAPICHTDERKWFYRIAAGLIDERDSKGALS
jgi:hypothetical protein